MAFSLPAAVELGTPMPLNAQPAVLDFLASRRSAGALTLEAPGPSAAELDILLRVAARVPDHGKLAPWRMIVLDTPAKTEFAARLQALAEGRGDAKLAAKLAKLKTPPMGIAVVSRPRQGAIPEWEQVLSAGCVCTNLLYGATAMGYGANWITDWYAYDPEALTLLGLTAGERLAGFVFIGTAREAPLERERADWRGLITHWRP